MNSLKRVTFSTALAMALAAPASAAVLTASNTTAQSIPDFVNPNPGTISSTINFGASGSINSLEITVAVAHTWVGDLIYQLTHGATTVVLMNRPGVPSTSIGDSTNLSESAPLRFSDSFSPAAETIGSGDCDTNATVGVSAACLDTTYQSDELLSAFNGQDLSGDWILNISDNAGQDVGRLLSWSITADVGQVPEPATLGLLAMGLAGLGIGRRRKV